LSKDIQAIYKNHLQLWCFIPWIAKVFFRYGNNDNLGFLALEFVHGADPGVSLVDEPMAILAVFC
jgi:hypothetical protein